MSVVGPPDCAFASALHWSLLKPLMFLLSLKAKLMAQWFRGHYRLFFMRADGYQSVYPRSQLRPQKHLARFG